MADINRNKLIPYLSAYKAYLDGQERGKNERLLSDKQEEYKKGTAAIVSLAFEGKMYNPKIFSSRYRAELMSLSGDTGGRQLIDAHADALLCVEAESEAEVTDIDRPV